MGIYEERLYRKLDEINGFQHEKIRYLDRYPVETAELVLKELLRCACQAQNEANIILGRTKISEVNEDWLQIHIVECAEKYLDLSDEWEYRRFLELIVHAVPDLKESVLALGENSENAEIRETAKDYRD